MSASGASSGKVVAVRCDVRKEEEVVAMFEKAVRELGGVDVLISNAGLANDEPLLTGTTAGWREMLEVGQPNYSTANVWLCLLLLGECAGSVCVQQRVSQAGEGEGNG